MPLSSLHNRPSPSRSHRRPPFSLPSTVLVTVLFLELRKIEKLEEENVLEVNWLMELPREVMVCMFILVSQNREIYATTEEHVILQTNEAKQLQFRLVSSGFPATRIRGIISLDQGLRV
ncbi:uncharacterized protein LOC131647756 isoform X2 [Vicia villosa]|uniref:uncharacterized protein LOC131647756 isoform X2 n=1 Tax=Vicia villosa TaxID=3911 RepID=UPI00273B8A2E|nr:uncharacterized protein LOC131647756 isoform X2 [Vicia villosa]